MDINLVVYDMQVFLDKYTRFMTKDIYISYKMYNNFLNQYEYLFNKLKKDRFLYSDNKLYKKVMDIISNKIGLIRLHNKKYLKRALVGYDSFFSRLGFELDPRKKMIVLSEEDSTYVVGEKNFESLIVSKICYLIGYKGYLDKNILVLTDDDNKAKVIRERCKKSNIDISIFNIRDYGKRVLKEGILLDDNKRYNILIDYIINDLFRDKIRFNSFYKAFHKYIYLNKDYKDYETFKDYHNYMYKRKFLASGLELKNFNKSEIKKRKSYLRTINNDSLKYKEEIDIANFLYLNNVDYFYDYNDLLFKVNYNGKDISIKYINSNKEIGDEDTTCDGTIYLYSTYNDDKTYLEVLAYELVKRRYPLELVSEDDLYTKLCSTNIENYFSEFCLKVLIPLIKYYENNGDFDKLSLDKLEIEEFFKIYQVYDNYVKENNLIKEKEMLNSIEKTIKSDEYKYLFMVGDISLNCDIPTFSIVNDYQETELIKENIKLLYDYKKYLSYNQVVPIGHVYLNNDEVSILTKRFLKDNLKIINDYLENTSKDVTIYEYDDSNRLHVYRNIGDTCFNILDDNKKSTLIGVKSLKDINILVGDKFSKLDKKTLSFRNKGKIEVEEVLKIDKLYDRIILPYLIKDSYHDDLFKEDYWYAIKVMLYVALSKCKRDVIILCPSNKKEEVNKIFGCFKKISC